MRLDLEALPKWGIRPLCVPLSLLLLSAWLGYADAFLFLLTSYRMALSRSLKFRLRGGSHPFRLISFRSENSALTAAAADIAAAKHKKARWGRLRLWRVVSGFNRKLCLAL